MEFEGGKWTYLVLDRDHWRIVMNFVIDILVAQSADKFSTSWKSVLYEVQRRELKWCS
jgi:hypothetical protein